MISSRHPVRTMIGAMLVLTVVGCAPAKAKVLPATPDNIAQVLASASPGDRIVLGPGLYENSRLPRRAFKPSITIDAANARIAGWYFRGTSGVTMTGGTYLTPTEQINPKSGKLDYGRALRFDNAAAIKVINGRFVGPGKRGENPTEFGEGIGLFVVGVTDIEVTGNTFTGFRSGLAFSRVDGFKIINNTYTDMRSDGMQFGESRNGVIEGNTCQGTRIRDKEHPDCIQMWSRPTSLPTSDMVIRKNRMEGGTQGIGMFNHVRNGVNDGGFDRIVIEDNDIDISFPQGIALYEGRDSTVRNNRVRTQPGARFMATINVAPEVQRCGNVIASAAGKPGKKEPRCQ